MGWVLQRLFGFFVLEALLIVQWVQHTDATVGVVYGLNGDNLPVASSAVKLLNDNGVTKVRIYGTTSELLKAFVGSNIEVIVGIANSDLATVGASNTSAASWLVTNVVPYALSVNITAIAVGQEVMTSFQGFTTSLVRTMMWIHDALIVSNLASTIRVSTPLSTSILAGSFPPSQSVFNQTLVPAIQPLLQFLNLTGSFAMLNVRTYDVFQNNFQAVSLEYALFEPEIPTTDTYANLAYYSLFDALIDACYAAMKQLGFADVRIVVTETGWPYLGDSNENGANVSNAEKYANNLVRHVANNSGTPAMPGVPITAYLYELFNENLNPGPTSERNYGIFNYNLYPNYNVDFSGQGRTPSGNGTVYTTWCVAKTGASTAGLQQALDWACGQGAVNCTAISAGGQCFTPDTIQNHASWAFNAYYQKNGINQAACDFGGVGQIVTFNPSYASCVFQASNNTNFGNGVGGGPASSPSSAATLQFQIGTTFCCLLVFLILNLRHL